MDYRRIDRGRHAPSAVDPQVWSPSPELAAEPNDRGLGVKYFNLHLGDYSRDTEHLSLAEHGAYFKLMRIYYAKEAPIPCDQAVRLAGAKSRAEIAAVSSVLQEFFTKDGECWRHKRCDAEITLANDAIDRAVSAGRLGAAKRWHGKGIAPPSKNNGVPIAPLPEPHKGSNGGWIAPNLQPPTSDSEDQGSSAASQPSDPSGLDPRKAIFDLGKRVLGASAGGLISAAITRKGEERVAEIIAGMAIKSHADPRAYFQAATRVGHDRVVV